MARDLRPVNIYKKPFDRLIRKACRKTATPFSNALLSRYHYGDFRSILMMKVDPFFYEWNNRISEYELDAQLLAFFKKNVNTRIDIDREREAYKKWVASEKTCSEVNATFRKRWSGESKNSHDVEEVYYLARRKVRSLLGSVGPSDLDLIRDHARHGPGADTSCKRRQASLYAKFQSPGEVTAACSDLFELLFNSSTQDFRFDLVNDAIFVDSNKLSFVAKTALIDRAICVEPRWNVYVQLGIGSLLSNRLRRVGVDLKDQARNSKLALSAIDDGLATLDLSSASDSIAINLVIDLLAECDPLWLDLILKSRTPYASYRGAKVRLEKISSMGNGFTFPLESLVFWSLAYGTVKYLGLDTRKIGVYGDDIIVPRGASSLLIEVLNCFGFTVNTDKSFTSGSFFESCGSDYFCGKEVRPVFLKEDVVDLASAMKFHNQLIQWAGRNAILPGLLNRDRFELADIIYRATDPSLRFSGPQDAGDGVFHRPFTDWTIDRRRTTEHRSSGQEGCYIIGIESRPSTKFVFGWRGLLYSKLSVDSGGTGHRVNGPGARPRTSRILVTSIPDYVLTSSSGLSSATF